MKSRRMRWVGHEIQMEEKRNAYKLMVVKPEGKKSSGKTKTYVGE
jgi:hypothetical protein